MTIVVNHCGSPIDRDSEGIARWKQGLREMAAQPNIAIKLSVYQYYAAERSQAALQAVLMTCIDAFGTGRAMFATDYSVGRRAMSYADMCAFPRCGGGSVRHRTARADARYCGAAVRPPGGGLKAQVSLRP